MRPLRTLHVRCPDWSVVAAGVELGIPATAPVAVLHGNRVVDRSPAAYREGVTRGLRRREAQSRCPGLVVVGHDPARDARVFEPVVAAVEQVAVGVAVLRPGDCALPARGPARYFGGEERAAERIVEQIGRECGVEARVGVADSGFAAGLAARTGRIVPPGHTPAFLADLDVTTLERPELADLLRRLGVRTLGEFADLPAGDVLARFGFDAALAHRLAAGADPRPLPARRPPVDLTVTDEYDEPLDRVDTAAFAARSLAERLHQRLAAHELACTRLGVEAVTAHGQELYRTWRHDGLLTTAEVTDRVRWQLEGWLRAPGQGRGDGPGRPAPGGPVEDRPTAGIRRLRLVPAGVVPGVQPGLWGGSGEGRERAARSLARVQGLLGPDRVVTAVLRGGRSPADRVTLVPWGEAPAGADGSAGSDAPWPGRLPPPAPATVLPEPLPATVVDAAGQPVTVSARLTLSAAPAWLTVGRSPVTPRVAVVEWAGPWPADERWWDPAGGHRVARCQVLLADGRALLLARSDGEWTIEAGYD